ncbi:MAG: DUF1801 domain-containing protein [Bacteroidetes bacterium]|nr:DUF1801 domain-containing protein [Bacteroidota bacterium]
MEKLKINTVDEYIAQMPESQKFMLESIRSIIKSAAPMATEVISYQMPAYKLHTVLVYFASNKNHVGFYPTNKPIEIFKEQLKNYKTSKGAIQFPLNQKLPVTLIKKIVAYRIKMDLEQAALKKKKK